MTPINDWPHSEVLQILEAVCTACPCKCRIKAYHDYIKDLSELASIQKLWVCVSDSVKPDWQLIKNREKRK